MNFQLSRIGCNLWPFIFHAENCRALKTNKRKKCWKNIVKFRAICPDSGKDRRWKIDLLVWYWTYLFINHRWTYLFEVYSFGWCVFGSKCVWSCGRPCGPNSEPSAGRAAVSDISSGWARFEPYNLVIVNPWLWLWSNVICYEILLQDFFSLFFISTTG